MGEVKKVEVQEEEEIQEDSRIEINGKGQKTGISVSSDEEGEVGLAKVHTPKHPKGNDQDLDRNSMKIVIKGTRQQMRHNNPIFVNKRLTKLIINYSAARPLPSGDPRPLPSLWLSVTIKSKRRSSWNGKIWEMRLKVYPFRSEDIKVAISDHVGSSAEKLQN